MLRRHLLKHKLAIPINTRTPPRRLLSSKPNPEGLPTRPRILSRLLNPVHNYYKNSVPFRGITTGIIQALTVLLFLHIEWNYFYEYGPCDGISMMPTINSYGDSVLISKYYRRGRGIEVGDLVSFAHPINPQERAVKRIVGLPGDFVGRDTPGVGEGMMIQVCQRDY